MKVKFIYKVCGHTKIWDESCFPNTENYEERNGMKIFYSRDDCPDCCIENSKLNPVAEMVQTAVVGLDKPMPRESQRLTGLTDEYKKVTTTSTNTAV